MKRIYLDYAATTPVHPEVVRAMTPHWSEHFGNPSSIYSYGQEAKGTIEDAREKVAELIGASPEEIVFTSGGTEADNFALKGTAFAAKSGNHIITSAIEHHAIHETCSFLERHGFEVTYLPVDGHGLVDPDDLERAITKETILVSVMQANNEVGTVQPIAELTAIAREAGVCFHSDTVQTAGHIPTDVDELGVDLLSLSAHKLYGPKGVGALYVRKGTRLVPFMHGGGQERNRRGGTENVPGIAGFGKAAEIAGKETPDEAERLTGFRQRLIEGILGTIDNSRLNGHPEQRLPNNVNVSIDYVEGESMLLNLDLEGICASTGSACSSASLEASHVLLAMGLAHEQAHASLRFTMGKWTETEHVDRVLEVLPPIVAKLRAMSPLLKSRQ
ncbi:MAG: cysteine desulfurase NifS [Acidimicrobiia bacterium]